VDLNVIGSFLHFLAQGLNTKKEKRAVRVRQRLAAIHSREKQGFSPIFLAHFHSGSHNSFLASHFILRMEAKTGAERMSLPRCFSFSVYYRV
jgi:hypothetical protein